MLNTEYCYFCGSKLNQQLELYKNLQGVFDGYIVSCHLCGKYVFNEQIKKDFEHIRNKIAFYLYFNKTNSIFVLLNDNNYKLFRKKNEYLNLNYFVVTNSEVEASYPVKFSEKIDKCILALATKAEFPGNCVELTNEEVATICCIKRVFDDNNKFNLNKSLKQIQAFLGYLKENKYINIDTLNPIGKSEFELKPELWLRADELGKSDNSNKNVFIALSFDKSNKDLLEIRETIEKVLSDKEFKPQIMDKLIHNTQIVPYMFKQIRDSRFLIMETTYSNLGAYYEAGYAEGLGKQVIICCRNKEFEKQYVTKIKHKIKNRKVIKSIETVNSYRKPIHFDIAQKQLLIWNDIEDLKIKLKQWIEALFG